MRGWEATCAPLWAEPCRAPRPQQLVFVYGTLLRGEANHGWLLGAAFLGEAWMEGLVLHNLGPFPMAVEGEGRCHGEVYGVSEEGLARLDQLEAVPRLYRRQWHRLGDGQWAWVYVGRAQQVRHSPRLEHGRWRQRERTRERQRESKREGQEKPPTPPPAG